MQTGQPISDHVSSPTFTGIAPKELCWYALRTQPRHEKKAAASLQHKGVTMFLPLLTETHRWSDRSKTLRIPLFPGYVFVRTTTMTEARLLVLRTPGVISFVGAGGTGMPIPDKQIEDVQTLLACNMPCALYPFLRAGQLVRIHGGCLDGLEGILVARNSNRSLVISLSTIQQSLAIRIEGYDVEILSPPHSAK